MIDLLGPARRCLEFVGDYWDTRGWDLPTRRYLAPGVASAIADDAAQFVVGLTSVVPGTGSTGMPSRGIGSSTTPSVTYAARLIRCAYVSDALVASAEAIDVDGQQSLLDAGRLLSSLIAWRQSEPITISLNASSVVGQLEPVGPEGAVMGHVAPFTISQFAAVDD